MIYFFARRWKEEELAKRISRILCGTEHAEKWDGETRWHIGRANNFWLHPEGDEKYVLNCRYATPEMNQALSVVLDWLLGVEITEETS